MTSPRREQDEAKYSEEEIRLWIELEKVRQQTTQIQGEKIYQGFKEFCDVLRGLADTYKDYILKKTLRVAAPLYILMTVIFLGAVWLTATGKISGEAMALLIGTIIGYIITLISEHYG
jgi:uncharacterized membrane-anchored protein YhcB (DUF1043 family)